jgi:exopolysaccharide biosynthesis polyprenyl glycosylphosphotransferase
MIRGTNRVIHNSQRLLDVAILVLITVAVPDNLIPKELAKVLSVYCSFLIIVVFPLFHLYQSWRKIWILHQIRVLAMAWLTVLIIFNLIIILLSNKEQLAVLRPFGLFASTGFNYWALMVFAGLGAIRVILHTIMGFIRSRGHNLQTAIIIGAGDTGRKLGRYLYNNKWIGIQATVFFDDKIPEGTQIKTGPTVIGLVRGTIDLCQDYIERNDVDLVFLALPMSAEKKITRIVGKLGTSGHAVLMVQDLFSFGIQKARTQQFGELQLMDFYLFPLWKRIFDIVFSTTVVLITLPIWLVIAAAIKMEDGGPVFFRHPRVMEGGKGFQCLKFRSMHLNAEDRLEQLLDQDPILKQQWQQAYKLVVDPRVTRVGKFLRRFNLDELPQFINVLSGEMSVVGARPVVPEELVTYYREITLTYCAMKPGITGLWQVSHDRDVLDYAGRVELDRRYILNCTIWLDLAIIARTIWRTLLAKNI